jgi:membrane protease YdiL (CAAX protease family)
MTPPLLAPAPPSTPARATTGTVAVLPRLSWPSAVALHLVPGIGLLTVYLAAVPALRAAGLPPLWGLLAGIGLVLVPVELGLVVGSLRRRGLGLRRPVRADLPALVLALAAALVLPGLGVALEPWLAAGPFGWLPDWYGAGLADVGTWSAGVQAATLAGWFLLAVVLGPIAEELYFRGWLLPRMPGGRTGSAVASAALFALYHLWQPQAVVTVLLTALPLVALVRRRGTVVLSVLVHCTVNLVAFGALLAGVLAR